MEVEAKLIMGGGGREYTTKTGTSPLPPSQPPSMKLVMAVVLAVFAMERVLDEKHEGGRRSDS